MFIQVQDTSEGNSLNIGPRGEEGRHFLGTYHVPGSGLLHAIHDLI